MAHDDAHGDHYFTAKPASPDERRTMSVNLAGRDLTVESAPGIFSPAHIDLGTQVLLRTVPRPPRRAPSSTSDADGAPWP